MQLIMKTDFDKLRLNPSHDYNTNSNGDKQVVKIYCGEVLIAKKLKQKKSIRYFGIADFQQYLTQEDD